MAAVGLVALASIYAWMSLDDGESSPSASTSTTTTTASASQSVTFADPLIEPTNNWKTKTNTDEIPCGYRFTGTGYAIESDLDYVCPALPEFRPDLDELATSRIEADVRFISEVASPPDESLINRDSTSSDERPPGFGLGCRASGDGEAASEYFIAVYADGGFRLYSSKGTSSTN